MGGNRPEVGLTYPPLAGLPAPHLVGWSIAYWSFALVVAAVVIWVTLRTATERLVRLALILVVAASFAICAAFATSPPLTRLASPFVVRGTVAVATGVLDRDRVAAVAGVAFGGLLGIMLWYGLGAVPWWVIPPLGGTFDPLLTPGPNEVLLAVVLLAGGGVAWRRTRRTG